MIWCKNNFLHLVNYKIIMCSQYLELKLNPNMKIIPLNIINLWKLSAQWKFLFLFLIGWILLCDLYQWTSRVSSNLCHIIFTSKVMMISKISQQQCGDQVFEYINYFKFLWHQIQIKWVKICNFHQRMYRSNHLFESFHMFIK